MASSKPISAYRSDIKLLLGMGTGSQLSNDELDRALKLAVGTLDRFFPQELVAEFIWDVDVDDESFTTPTAASATAIVNAQTLNGVAAGGTLTIADNTPEVTRRLTVTLTDANASITSLTIIVKGYDAAGGYIEEYWHLKDLPSGTAVQGTKYFKYVSEVEVDVVGGTQDVADTISVGTGNAYDSFISLVNKPFKYHSDVVTNAAGTTTYARDTDYEIDYINGRIKYVNGGAMAAGTAYLIDYDLDTTMLDIETLIPDYLEVVSVQHVQADKVPAQFEGFTIHGRFMWLTTSGGGVLSQTDLGDNDHIRLFYTKPHGIPAATGGGTFPAYLDELVTYGASGWGLVIEALERLHQVTTDIASARTELGLTTTDHASLETALDILQAATTGVYAEITNALDSLVVASTGPYAEATNALDALVVATTGPYDKMTTALNLIAGLMNEVWAVADTGRLKDAENIWKTDDPGESMFYVEDADLSAHVDGGAEELLQTGDGLINAVNTGSQAAALNAEYARAKIAIGQQYAQRRRDLVDEARAFIQEAQTYLQEVQGWASKASLYTNESMAWIAKANAYIAEAQAWVAKGQLAIAEAGTYINKLTAYIAEADRYLNAAELERRNSDALAAEGNRRVAEYTLAIRDRVQLRRSPSWGTTRGYS